MYANRKELDFFSHENNTEVLMQGSNLILYSWFGCYFKDTLESCRGCIQAKSFCKIDSSGFINWNVRINSCVVCDQESKFLSQWSPLNVCANKHNDQHSLR